MEVTVLGAGVSGLTTSIRLLESGFNVKIVTEKMSPETVSDVAAAWWYPFLAEPVEKTNKWSSYRLPWPFRVRPSVGSTNILVNVKCKPYNDKQL